MRLKNLEKKNGYLLFWWRSARVNAGPALFLPTFRHRAAVENDVKVPWRARARDMESEAQSENMHANEAKETTQF